MPKARRKSPIKKMTKKALKPEVPALVLILLLAFAVFLLSTVTNFRW